MSIRTATMSNSYSPMTRRSPWFFSKTGCSTAVCRRYCRFYGAVPGLPKESFCILDDGLRDHEYWPGLRIRFSNNLLPMVRICTFFCNATCRAIGAVHPGRVYKLADGNWPVESLGQGDHSSRSTNSIGWRISRCIYLSGGVVEASPKN